VPLGLLDHLRNRGHGRAARLLARWGRALAHFAQEDDAITDDRGLFRRLITQPGLVLVLGLLIVALVVAAVALAGLALLLGKTTVGLQMRAAATDFTTARLLGVSANRVITLAVLLAGVIAAAVAVLLTARQPYVTSDFALHDLGQGLADNVSQGKPVVGAAHRHQNLQPLVMRQIGDDPRIMRIVLDDQKDGLAGLQAQPVVRQLLDAPIPRIALENPVSVISSRIRKPDQIIQPWQFGHGFSITVPLPRQRGHGCDSAKSPWLSALTPRPLHSGQMIGAVPGCARMAECGV